MGRRFCLMVFLSEGVFIRPVFLSGDVFICRRSSGFLRRSPGVSTGGVSYRIYQPISTFINLCLFQLSVIVICINPLYQLHVSNIYIYMFQPSVSILCFYPMLQPYVSVLRQCLHQSIFQSKGRSAQNQCNSSARVSAS